MPDGLMAGTRSNPRRSSSSIPTPRSTRRWRKPDAMSAGSWGTASESTTSPTRLSASRRWFHASPDSSSWLVASPAEAASLTENGSQAGLVNELIGQSVGRRTARSHPSHAARRHAGPGTDSGPVRRRHVAIVIMTTLVVVVSGCAPSPGKATPSTSRPSTAIPATGDAGHGPVGPLTAPGGPFLLDRYGRAVLLHGVDLVYKVPPYEVEVSGSGPNVLTVPEVQRMAALGFDVVRLGIIWKGLEPGTAPINDPAICAPGAPRASGPHQFNASVLDAYLARLDVTIALLGRY